MLLSKQDNDNTRNIVIDEKQDIFTGLTITSLPEAPSHKIINNDNSSNNELLLESNLSTRLEELNQSSFFNKTINNIDIDKNNDFVLETKR